MLPTGPTGLLTPALHELTDSQWKEWSHWLALCTEAVNQNEGHYLDAYLDLAREAGYSHLSLYSKATSGRATWPTDYDAFHEMEEHSREMARKLGKLPPSDSDAAPPSRPSPPSPPPTSATPSNGRT